MENPQYGMATQHHQNNKTLRIGEKPKEAIKVPKAMGTRGQAPSKTPCGNGNGTRK